MKPVSTSPDTRQVELAVGGMTCAACAARIERRLNKVEGVSASVNYATERATIVVDPTLTIDDPVSMLVDTIVDVGYTASVPSNDESAHVEQRAADLRRRLIVAVVLGVPVLVLSMIPPTQFPGWQWVALVMALPVSIWSAWPFHRAMVLNLRHRQATMDTLVSVGVIAALTWSIWALIATEAGEIGMTMNMSMDVGDAASHHIYLEVASTVVAFILAGRWFETRSKRRAGDSLRSLLDLAVSDVDVRGADGVTVTIPADQLEVGDVFVVRPGDRVATDGVVIEGRSAVDLSLLTGESVPVEVSPGSEVVGASVNSTGLLIVKATSVGADTQLAHMARLVSQAQSGKAPVQRLADRVSAVFVPIVISLAVMTTIGWLIVDGSTERSFAAGVAVLIIACPCALGLATPTALLVGTGRGAQLGILIRGPEVLESTRRVDTLVLDKTGTVTTGTMRVVGIAPAVGVDETRLLALAGAVEAGSRHPIAVAVTTEAILRLGEISSASGVQDHPGVGISGRVGDVVVEIGRAPADSALDDAPGATLIEVRADGRPIGIVAVADEPKPSSAAAVASARALGLRPMLLTGDRADAAQAVAAAVGIAAGDVRAEVLPAEKLAAVRALQAEGRVVAMAGDGVNDAAALAAADLGIAMGTGADVAVNASDLTLVRSELTAVVDAIRLSRRTLATIRGNLFWAFGYNVAAIPLAVSGRLSPVIAGAAMAFSSVFVVSNSLRLRSFR
ncbi:MAG: heavy metal translocating P-type ATPase [Actinomycetota bacterium]|jgi:Cu+-exporting ATPase|nr:heavy metal translocating P-type ATPase [Actinomycetota bacterium]